MIKILRIAVTIGLFVLVVLTILGYTGLESSHRLYLNVGMTCTLFAIALVISVTALEHLGNIIDGLLWFMIGYSMPVTAEILIHAITFLFDSIRNIAKQVNKTSIAITLAIILPTIYMLILIIPTITLKILKRKQNQKK